MRTQTSLRELRACDIMQSDVVLLPLDLPLPEAVRRLVQHRLTGAPVINHEGSLVGMLTSADFLKFPPQSQHHGASPCVYSDWQVICPEDLPQDTVRDRMSKNPVTATPETPVLELARLMVDRRVHRVVIVDGQRHPIGLVSSTDILAALASWGEAIAAWSGPSDATPSRFKAHSDPPRPTFTRKVTLDVGQ